MPLKKPGKNGAVRVTFSLPRSVSADSVHVCGDFNGWSTDSHPLKKYKDGHFAATVDLDPGHQYRYRYLIDGARWENDWEADEYVANEYGGEDSVVHV
jgi:1,4-alpha-glucan branching enzyme